MAKQLNPQQQEAVNCNSNKILCLAGAGAGKTATMIERISRLVKDGVAPSSILVLTFTNAAGLEMKERYKKIHPTGVIPEFRTFHSFCYSLIVKDKELRNLVGYDKVPTVVEECELKRLEKSVKMQCNIKLSDAKLAGEGKLTPQEQFEVEMYKKALKKMIRQENIITFDILCYDVGNLFVQNHECVKRYKEQYKYIFVDEFQDTDPKQIQFLNSFKGDDYHFYFCGDCLQNIYQFRNCSNETIKILSKDDSWTKIRLFENYRSTRQICEFANKMSRYADKDYRIEMNGQKDGNRVRVIYGAASSWTKPISDDHMAELMDMIRAMKGGGAVLCRSNKEVEYVCSVLQENGIAFGTNKPNEDAVHILKSAVDDDYMLDWLSSFLTAAKYTEYLRAAAQVETPDIRWFANIYGQTPGINSRGKSIVAIRKILKDTTKPIISRCADILAELKMENILLDEIPEADSDIIECLISNIEATQSQDLYVGTIHSSKGLEYGTVFVMGVDDKSFPLDKGEEMLNLYYVAITRAQNELVIFRK